MERIVDDRWREHDLLREYWQTKLSDRERRDWHRQAGKWLCQQAEELRASQGEREVEAWSLEVQKTWANYLRRAFWHFAGAGEAESALQAASSIFNFLYRWGEWAEDFQLGEKALQLARENRDEQAIADWSHQLGILAHDRGEYEEAERLYRESLGIEERLGNLAGKAVTLHQLGRLRWAQGRKGEAEGLLKQSLEIFERIGHQRAKEVREDLERLLKGEDMS